MASVTEELKDGGLEAKMMKLAEWSGKLMEIKVLAAIKNTFSVIVPARPPSPLRARNHGMDRAGRLSSDLMKRQTQRRRRGPWGYSSLLFYGSTKGPKYTPPTMLAARIPLLVLRKAVCER